MNETVGERIEKLIAALGIKKVRFAEMINVDQSFVTQMTKGKRNPSDRTLADICRVFKVRMEWLKDGDGDMFASTSEARSLGSLAEDLTQRERALVKSFLELPQSSREAVVDFVEQCARELNAQPPEPEAGEVDLASEVAALKRQNQELLARLEAIEKEDEMSGRIPGLDGGSFPDFHSSGLFSGTANKKSPRR